MPTPAPLSEPRFSVATLLLVTMVLARVEAQSPAPGVSTASVVIVPASSDEATVTVHLTGVDALTPRDLAPGPFAGALKPTPHVVPEFRKIDVSGEPNNWTATLVVGNLIAFGESTVPLLVRGEPVHTLRFQKPGLVARAPVESGFEIKEGKQLFVVLENPTAFAYSRVRARWRFNDTEICHATPDASAADGSTPGDTTRCDDPTKWVTFAVPKHAPVTLRVNAPAEWFRDAQTGFPRAAKRSGVLTLQYANESAPSVIHEQVLPLDVQFNPGDRTIFRNLLRIAWWLAIGAVVALGLRVVVPNYRRKEMLKEQLNDARDTIRDISIEIALQVLLKVETLTLEQLRRRSWIVGPGFADIAQRIENGLGCLRRKIEFTRRLDTARQRKLQLLDQDVPPTRLDAIERQLNAACELLQREQLTEQEWVIAQQRLETAGKLLAEPTKEEKDAFHGYLVQRWKTISAFFGRDGRRLKVPDALAAVKEAFPAADALPEETDEDGSQWIQAIGPRRADLQISALEVLRDFVFLAPFASDNAKRQLKDLCAAPSIEDLEDARLVMREISDGVCVGHVVEALRDRRAVIEMTPQSVRTNEKAYLALRFRDPKLDTAGARLRLRCEWIVSPVAEANGHHALRAYGWDVYCCFPDGPTEWEATARFYLDGAPVKETLTEPPASGEPLVYRETIRPQMREQDWGNRMERIFPEAIQIGAALLVPLATLAVTQSNEGATGRWWELIGVGFGSEMIRSILTGKPEHS